jgi:signal transduction histidine kinase
LLAPTVVVSGLLIATCLAGALYINSRHVDISQVFAENVASTLAAQRLEMTVKELVQHLKDEHGSPKEDRRGVLEERTRRAREQLQRASALANLEREQELVNQISKGLDEFFAQWEKRLSQAERPSRDRELAALLEQKVLIPCDQLRRFNTEQVEQSELGNRRVVQQLTWGLLAAGLAAPLGGLLVGYAMARGMYQSICQLSVRIRDAAGRLNRQLPEVTLEDVNDLPDLHRQMQGVVSEIEHVVERLQLSERAVLRADQLAAVGQVAAGVAHELRNPLTSVKMLVQTGLEGPHPGLPGEDLAIIEHEIRRMEACIQTFLDFARPPSCERRPTDLLQVVRRTISLVEGRARKQKVPIHLDLPARPVELSLDGEQIHQVLINLLINSLDALSQGGEIWLKVRDRRPADSVVTVCLRDNGPGISPAIKAHLFQPFISGKETGMGLGLSICLRLIEAHGGTIQGDNLPGGGAEFSFTLPA